MLIGIFSITFWGIILVLPSLFITTVYTIGLYSRIIFGYSGITSSLIKIHNDINIIDLLFFFPFIFVVGIWGLYPPVLYFNIL